MGCRDLCQSENYSYLEELKAYLYTIGVRNWRIFTIFPVGRAANHPEFQLTDEEFTGVLEFIKKVRKEGRVHLSYGCEGFSVNMKVKYVIIFIPVMQVSV